MRKQQVANSSSGNARALPMMTISALDTKRPILHMPAPRAAIRHAIPVLAEAVIAPVVIFYLALEFTGFRGALIAALVWSITAVVRRVHRGQRISTLLALDVFLLSFRTAIAFVTKSALLYFLQPIVWGGFISTLLIISVVIHRPFTQRFAHDFCPLDAELVARPRIQQFFRRVSLLWAAVLLTNSGIILWLLLTSSLQTFVIERTCISWVLTGSAIVCSIFGFTSTMRNDGFHVEWGDKGSNDAMPLTVAG